MLQNTVRGPATASSCQELFRYSSDLCGDSLAVYLFQFSGGHPFASGSIDACQLLTGHRHGKPAPVSCSAVFPQEYALPGAKAALSITHWQGQVGAGEHGSDVSWHIIRTFRRVFEERITVGYQPCHVTLQVGTHIGVGVLAQDQ